MLLRNENERYKIQEDKQMKADTNEIRHKIHNNKGIIKLKDRCEQTE